MLTLTKATAKLSSFNPRAEKHGEENVPAGDLKFEVKVHSTVLDNFDRSYRPFLFRPADAAGDQPSLMQDDDLTSLAKPNLKPLRLDEEFPGYVLRIDTGLGLSDPVVLADAKLSGFVFEAIEGGSVSMIFSAAVHPDSDQAGELCSLIQDTVELSLEPPKSASQRAQADIDDDLPGDEQQRRGKHPPVHAVA